jgi:2-methylcitrate dehydratase PrpD
MIYGAAGERQFQDAVVRDPAVTALRAKVIVQPDAAVDPAQCDLAIRLKDGRTFRRHIRNALGSLKNPMSDKALEAKFFDLADGILPAAQARQLAQACWTIEKSLDAGALARQASI